MMLPRLRKRELMMFVRRGVTVVRFQQKLKYHGSLD